MLGQRSAVDDLRGAVPVCGRHRHRRKASPWLGRKPFQNDRNRDPRGPPRKGSGIIDPLDRFQSILMNRFSIFIKGGYAHMPLPKHRCLVSLFPKHSGQSQSIRCNQAGTAHPRKDTLVVQPKSHPAGQNTVTGGRTYRRRTMGISEKHPLLCQAVAMGWVS